MKKRIVALALAMTMGMALLAGCGSSSSPAPAAPAASSAAEAKEEVKEEAKEGFVPTKNIDWMCTSSPGGGSDIFSRQISDILTAQDLVNGQPIVVTNKTDGAGEIGRNEVANTKGDKANYQLLTFNSGDLMPMVKNTKNRAANFQIIAIMAVDKQLIFAGKTTTYKSFAEAIDAAKNGTQVIIGGSKGDDIATFEAMIEEIGLTKDQMNYITYDSTGDAITAQLGGHIDFVISKPAAASEYVASGDLIPMLALANERYTGNLADAPTLSEIGDYENVEIPVWRGVAAPAAMSEEAVAYWSEMMKTVSESETWQTEYIEKNKLISDFKDHDAATEYVTQYEADYLATLQ